MNKFLLERALDTLQGIEYGLALLNEQTETDNGSFNFENCYLHMLGENLAEAIDDIRQLKKDEQEEIEKELLQADVIVKGKDSKAKLKVVKGGGQNEK